MLMSVIDSDMGDDECKKSAKCFDVIHHHLPKEEWGMFQGIKVS